MKTNKIFTIALLCLGLAGCKESVPENFGQITGIYFNNRLPNNTLIDNTAVTFIYEDNDYIEIPVKLQLMGRKSDYARQIGVSVESDNAVAGTDYILPHEPAALPSGATEYSYIITLKRTAALKQQIKSLTLKLTANDNFIIPFTHQVQTGGEKTSVERFVIEFSDQFTAPPQGWKKMFVGDFSQQKFELICDVLGIPRADFNESGKISSAKWMFIQSQMLAYVQDQVILQAAGEPYDERAFDQNGNPLSFESK